MWTVYTACKKASKELKRKEKSENGKIWMKQHDQKVSEEIFTVDWINKPIDPYCMCSFFSRCWYCWCWALGIIIFQTLGTYFWVGNAKNLLFFFFILIFIDFWLSLSCIRTMSLLLGLLLTFISPALFSTNYV